MKFMKLGTRPDTFQTDEAVRSVSSEVSCDLIIQVKGSKYLLHKFPLLSKCLCLQKLCSESPAASEYQIIQLPDFPGGTEAFELCAKFCYGITITLSAHNIVSARCAAEYLHMTEEVEKGNLIYKIDVFFSSCVLHGWRDSIITLQSTKSFSLWSEELGITSRCIESIASKVLAQNSKVSLSHSHSRRDDVSLCNGRGTRKGWWAEDLAELCIELYWRTMIEIKAGSKLSANLLGEALKIYACRWLPHISKDGQVISKQNLDMDSDSYKFLLESITSLLPLEKGAVSCGFLLKLLKTANFLNVSSSTMNDLARRVGIQLDEATVSDLLIPKLMHKNDMVYDIDIVMTIIEEFMLLQGQSPPTSPSRSRLGFERRRSRSAENINFEVQESRRSSSASHSSKLKVAKLVDRFLQEVARDAKLPLSKFVALSEIVPEFSRLDHDDLYKAIDIYLKAHPDLNKSERKRLCRILNCKKLSVDTCTHAAQNELLPLRVVVQVLFLEQTRAALASGKICDLPNNIKSLLIHPSKPIAPLSTSNDQWSVSDIGLPISKNSTLRKKLDEEVNSEASDGVARSSSKFKAFCAMPTPKKMFSKLLSINRNSSEPNRKN